MIEVMKFIPRAVFLTARKKSIGYLNGHCSRAHLTFASAFGRLRWGRHAGRPRPASLGQTQDGRALLPAFYFASYLLDWNPGEPTFGRRDAPHEARNPKSETN